MMFKEKNAASYVAEPLKLEKESDIHWSDQADIVIVGYGGAGACAALEAQAEGASVLAIERFEGGGATALSGGVVYGAGTPYQRAAGIDDSTEEMYKYLKQEIGDGVKDQTLKRFCEDSVPNFEWLTGHGVGFGSNAYFDKRSYPPKGYDLYYSGNEAAPQFARIAKPAPRGHRVSGNGYTGEDFFLALSESAAQKGVRVRTHTIVKRLIIDANDCVLGVEIMVIPEGTPSHKKHKKIIKKFNAWQRFMEPSALKAAAAMLELEQQDAVSQYVRATKGVILATGSFAFNREMVRHYAPKYGNAMPLGTMGCDGSGILLGQSVGADVGYMDSVTAWRSISPSEEFVKSVVVNGAGKRFVAEDTYLGHLGCAMADQPGQRAWLIIDSHTYWHAYKETIPRFGEESYIEFRGPLLLNLLFNTTRGKTLVELANKIGVDPRGLETTIEDYNQAVANGEDRLHKKKANLRAVGKGSYYAIDISVGSKKFLCPTIPMGGLCVDEESGQVLDESGNGIKKLYAAGRAAVGIPSAFYVSGTSIADCVFSGRRAGRCAVKEVTQKS